jgi:polyphosphate kinase
MDEFFEIRMSGLKAQLEDNPGKIMEDGLTVKLYYKLIADQAHQLVQKKYALLQEQLIPALSKEKIYFKFLSTWTTKQRQWARSFFHRESSSPFDTYST